MTEQHTPLCFQAGGCTLTFHPENGDLVGIGGLGEFISLGHPIWAVEAAGAGKTRILSPSNTHLSFRSRRGAEGALDLYWAGGGLSVTVHCRDTDGMPGLTIDVSLENEAIRTVRFPVIGNIPLLSEDGERDFLVLPWQNGFLIKNPLKNLLPLPDGPFWAGRFGGKYENDYPAQYSYQFMAYYTDRIGLYVATRDRDAYIKTIGLYLGEDGRSFEYRVTHTPEEMGKRRRYSSPFAAAVTLFEGDWQTCAGIYRRWALQQKWCPPAIAARDLPENLLKTDLWRINHGSIDLGSRTEEYLQTSRRLQQELNGALGLHWYGWDMGRHDVGYPEYIDPENPELTDWPERLAAYNKAFDEIGIVKIPYVNGRLWDQNTPCWAKENAAASAIKDENGGMLNEIWNLITILRAMCPGTKAWREKVVQFGEKYVLGMGFDGLYVDQIASFNATLCFDESHPHPVGGGTWWAESYCDMMRQLRCLIGNDKILTSESCCEVYGNVFDIFLVLDPNTQTIPTFAGSLYGESIPLFNMIYGDHMLTYGSNCSMAYTIGQFEFNLIRNTLWGVLPTIEGFTAADLAREDAPAYLAVARTAVEFFQKNKPDFLGGRPAAVLDVESPGYTVEWTRLDGYVYSKTYRSIQAVRWEFPDGSSAVFAYNFSESPVPAVLGGRTVYLPPHRLVRIGLDSRHGTSAVDAEGPCPSSPEVSAQAGSQ